MNKKPVVMLAVFFALLAFNAGCEDDGIGSDTETDTEDDTDSYDIPDSPICHTFAGSSITTDDLGNIYVLGLSGSFWNGPDSQPPLHEHSSGENDIFILKLDSSGEYLWHTFYGAGNDYAASLTIDSSGSIYVTGYSGHSWDGPGGQNPLNAHSETPGFYDILALKLDSSGAYQWHGFYGAGYGKSIGVGNKGNVYLTGASRSDGEKICVLKLDPNGTFQWQTSFGEYSTNFGASLAFDSYGNVLVTGQSWATWKGPTGESPLHDHSGNSDMFVFKLDLNGTYQWHTFIGGGSDDVGNSLAVDYGDNVYVTGSSASSWNGPAGENSLNAYSGNQDVFVFKLNSSGAYVWHTFYGSSGNVTEDSSGADEGHSLALDSDGNVHVTGGSWSSWNGPASETPLNPHPNHEHADIFVLKLDSSGAYQWHTFYDGESYSLVADESGNTYVTGQSYAWNDPDGQTSLNPYPYLVSHWGREILILKLDSRGTYQWHTFYGGDPGACEYD